jgi:hypothetical protein
MVGAVISLVLVVLATAQPGAAPKFSDWAAPVKSLEAIEPLSGESA